jgi:N-acetylglucosaminyldiphosphoundecaprenol N-acetyl-beta-D-mannosaminyltransferase
MSQVLAEILAEGTDVSIVTRTNVEWPHKVDLFGVGYTPTSYDEAVGVICQAAKQRVSAIVSCHAVHAVMTFCTNPEWRDKVNTFDMITPDGQPVRWALNLLYRAGLTDRVYGPELMDQLCRRAALDRIPIYLYGGTPEVLDRLKSQLCGRYPALQIAGAEAPPFRQLSEAEDNAVVQRINHSGAGLVFIGLGCPKQDLFAFDHRSRLSAVQVCVGAAFDFHAGVKPTAPAWMQRHGLEWVFRLSCEPRRLWKRYLVTNSLFVAKLASAITAKCLGLKRTNSFTVSTRASGTA